MSVKLYTFKCEQGYVRCSQAGSEFVGLNKASVYSSPDDIELQRAYAWAAAAGATDLRLVELTLTETDYYCTEFRQKRS